MSNLFNKIFNPTINEKISLYEKIIQLYKSQIGHCTTCLFYNSNTISVLTVDYGDCIKNSPIFDKKICNLTNKSCTFYQEDFSKIKIFQEKLKKLKGEEK